MQEQRSDTKIRMITECSVVLGPFWWIGTKRSDGRSGHKYVAIFVKTLDWFLWKLRGKDVGWRVSSNWMDGGDDYHSAALTIKQKNGVLYEASSHFPGWCHQLELNLRRLYLTNKARRMGYKPKPSYRHCWQPLFRH